MLLEAIKENVSNEYVGNKYLRHNDSALVTLTS